MTDVVLLEHYIDQSGYRLDFIAKKMGLSYQGLRNKMTGKSEFKTREVSILCNLLGLTSEVRDKIFFAQNVDFESTSA